MVFYERNGLNRSSRQRRERLVEQIKHAYFIVNTSDSSNLIIIVASQ